MRDGLGGGTLDVFRSKHAAMNGELLFQSGTISGEWVPIPAAGTMTQAETEAAADAAGAMTVGRPGAGTINPRNANEYFFVTTGGATGADALGRFYSLRLNPVNPTGPAELEVIYNADRILAAGGDITIRPDNIDASW